MADYRDLLRRAVEALPENNGAARRQVYEKARSALVGQLRAINPPLPSREVTQHRLQLEDCIRQVEQEATEQLLGGLTRYEETVLETKKPDPAVKQEEPAKPVAEVEAENPADVSDDKGAEPEAIAGEKPKSQTIEDVIASADADEAVVDAAVDAVEEPEQTSNAFANAIAERGVAEIVEPEIVESEPEPEKPEEPEEILPEKPIEAAIGPKVAEPFVVMTPDKAQAEHIRADNVSVADELVRAQSPQSQDSVAEEIVENGQQADVTEKPVRKMPRFNLFSRGKDAEPVQTVDPEIIPQTDTSTEAMSAVREVEVETSIDVDDGDGRPDPQNAIDHAIAMLDREASGEGGAAEPDNAAGKKSESVSPAAAQLAAGDIAPSLVDDEPSGNALTIFLVIFALLLAGAAGAGFWAWREGYVDFNAMFGQAQVSEQTTSVLDGAGQLSNDSASATDNAEGSPGNTVTATDDTANADSQTPETVVATVPDELSSATTPDTATPDSMVADETLGTTPDALVSEDPASSSIAEPNSDETKVEDRLPTEQTTEPATDTQDAAETATGDQSANPDAVAAATTTDGAQSLLLEASSEGTTGAVPYSGTVEWARGSDELGQPTLVGTASIPARNLSVSMLIRKNADPTLPASHLMEIDFDVSDSFIGGGISGLPGVLLKNEELVQGQPLIGASARIVGNSFLFALSASPQDVTTNLALLRDRKWVDLAMIYATGRRAIITLEKDDAAQKLFNDVMSIWASDPAPQ